MTGPFFTDHTPVTDEVLNVVAHLPTRSLAYVATNGFFKKMTDADFIRLAGNEQMLRDKGVQVDILEDQKGRTPQIASGHGAVHARLAEEHSSYETSSIWQATSAVTAHTSFSNKQSYSSCFSVVWLPCTPEVVNPAGEASRGTATAPSSIAPPAAEKTE